ncbi:hypothetical protein Tco_1053537 [Tanacetum coccineum]|uniref:Reverse transcriptase n=1 Tax=Tanacetum coccineum TaxID=301880 RepID=A0ABQ5GV00_9ASTR
MGRGTWYYSLGVSSIVDAFVRSEFGISSWRGSRVDGRSYLLSGAIDGSEANRIIRDSKSYKVRVGSNGNLLWEVSVLHGGVEKSEIENSYVMSPMEGGVRVAREDDRGVTEGREDVREVFQQRGSGAKRKLSRCGRNQMGNEPVIALPEGADDFIVYYDARSKDLEVYLVEERGRLLSRWMKLFNEYGFEAKYHLGKANVVVESWSRKKSEAKNKFWIDFLFDELRDRVVNDVVTQLKVLTSFLDDERGTDDVVGREGLSFEARQKSELNGARIERKWLEETRGVTVGVQLDAEQAAWKDDTDDESEDQELEAHYMYMAQLQEVTPDQVDNSGPICDVEHA